MEDKVIMGTTKKDSTNIIRIQAENELQGALKTVIVKEDRYQELTAKQIESLQDKLAKEHDSKNQIAFWSIFGAILLLNCIVFQHIQNSFAVLGIFVMEFVIISCLAGKLGQENALKLLNWMKNLIEEWVHNINQKKQK